MTTLMLLDAVTGKPGTYGGSISLDHLLGDIFMTPGGKQYILSLREDFFVGDLPNRHDEQRTYVGTFSLGVARGSITTGLDKSSRSMLKIAIESTNIQDFLDLRSRLYARIRIPHEELPRPVRRLEDISFVRGFRNDLRTLGSFLSNRWRSFSKEWGWTTFALVVLVISVATMVRCPNNSLAYAIGLTFTALATGSLFAILAMRFSLQRVSRLGEHVQE